MTTNPNFSYRGETSELDLREDLIVEAIQARGIDVQYVPRKWVTIDHALAEVTASSFGRSYTIEATVSGLDQLLRASYLLSQISFGGLGTATVKVQMSKRRFREEIPDDVLSSPGRPCEGDLIFVPHAKVLLEIKKADPESPLRSGGQIHVYTLDCELFKGTHEEVSTDSIDGLMDLNQIPQLLLGDNEIYDKTTVPGVSINSPGPKPLEYEPAGADLTITMDDVR
jgi:hypothetical protein